MVMRFDVEACAFGRITFFFHAQCQAGQELFGRVSHLGRL